VIKIKFLGLFGVPVRIWAAIEGLAPSGAQQTLIGIVIKDYVVAVKTA